MLICLPGRSTSEKSKSAVPNQKNQFDGTRREINSAIDRLCEFTGKEICKNSVFLGAYCYLVLVCEAFLFFLGLKVIFWDLQQPFIDNLYRNSVQQARLEIIMEVLDLVYSQTFIYIKLEKKTKLCIIQEVPCASLLCIQF